MTTKARVLNTLRRGNPQTMTPKQRAVRKLLEWQPDAQRIRFEGLCLIRSCRGDLLMSYVLPDQDHFPGLNPGEEFCGHYCPRCGWNGASIRPIKLPFRRGTES